MRNVFFFDFDGTLYSHKTNSIPASAQEALHRLHADGHLIVIATGRGPESRTFIEQELSCPIETMIFLNGQLIYHRGRLVFERFVTLPSMNLLMSKAKSRGYAYGGYCAAGEIVDQLNERVRAVWRDFNSPLPTVMGGFEEKYKLYQGHLYITKEEADELTDILTDYVTNWSHLYLVNLIAREAGKSQGMRWVMEEAGIEAERSFAFGDGFNDHDMLQAAGHGIAMGNASESLKQIADYVTGDVDEDGVYQALAHYNVI